MPYRFCINDKCWYEAAATAFHEACFPALLPPEFLEFTHGSFDPAPGVDRNSLRCIQCLIAKLNQQLSDSLGKPHVPTMNCVFGNSQAHGFVSYCMGQLWKEPRPEISESIELSGTVWPRYINTEGIY